jgi:hypothetical protein
MPAAIRTIGQPTGDAVEDARRLERSAWFGLRAVMLDAAEVPLTEGMMHSAAREAVRSAKAAWAQALRDLDALVMR